MGAGIGTRSRLTSPTRKRPSSSTPSLGGDGRPRLDRSWSTPTSSAPISCEPPSHWWSSTVPFSPAGASSSRSRRSPRSASGSAGGPGASARRVPRRLGHLCAARPAGRSPCATTRRTRREAPITPSRWPTGVASRQSERDDRRDVVVPLAHRSAVFRIKAVPALGRPDLGVGVGGIDPVGQQGRRPGRAGGRSGATPPPSAR